MLPCPGHVSWHSSVGHQPGMLSPASVCSVYWGFILEIWLSESIPMWLNPNTSPRREGADITWLVFLVWPAPILSHLISINSPGVHSDSQRHSLPERNSKGFEVTSQAWETKAKPLFDWGQLLYSTGGWTGQCFQIKRTNRRFTYLLIIRNWLTQLWRLPSPKVCSQHTEDSKIQWFKAHVSVQIQRQEKAVISVQRSSGRSALLPVRGPDCL